MGWISVKDSMPRKEGYYLIFMSTYYGAHPRIRTRIARYGKEFNRKKLHFYGSQVLSHKYITHWMELPKAPDQLDDIDVK